jgi:HSP20 family protein
MQNRALHIFCRQNIVVWRETKEIKMATTTWNPWTELEAFTRDLHRAFERSTAPSGQQSNGYQHLWRPAMDVSDTEEAYIIEADVPGLTIADINVQLEGTTLTISGERRATTPQGGRVTHAERSFGPFQRTFTLPTAVHTEAIQAAYSNGVLTVTVPKVDAVRTRRINVQAV